MSYYDNSNLFLSGSRCEVSMAMLHNTREGILKEQIVPYEQRLVAFLNLQGFKDDIIHNYPHLKVSHSAIFFGFFLSHSRNRYMPKGEKKQVHTPVGIFPKSGMPGTYI